MNRRNTSFNDYLDYERIKPEEVIVLRHAPWSKKSKIKNWLQLIGEEPNLFDEYQKTQRHKRVGAVLSESNIHYVASFVGFNSTVASFAGLNPKGAVGAVFVGLYQKKEEPQKITAENLRKEMKKGKKSIFKRMEKFEIMDYDDYFVEGNQEFILKFNFSLEENFHQDKKGKLIIDWPGAAINWYQPAHENIRVRTVLKKSVFVQAMQD